MRIYILTYSVWPADSTPTDIFWLVNEDNSRLTHLGSFATRDRGRIVDLIVNLATVEVIVLDDMPESSFIKLMGAEGYKTK